MNDERTTRQLRIISKNNLYIIAVIAFLSFGFKFALSQPFLSYASDLFFFGSVLIVLLIDFIYQSTEELFDERVQSNVLKIYQIGFYTIGIVGLLLYFIILSFRVDSAVGFAASSTINSAIFFCFLFSYINVRRHKMTFNNQIIAKPKQTYYRHILKHIIYLLGYFIAVFIIIFVIHLFTSINFVWPISVSILSSFINLSIQYFLFSIYEKNRFDEQEEEDVLKKRRYLSKNATLLLLITSIFAMFGLLVSGANSVLSELFRFNEQLDLKLFVYVLDILVKLRSFDFIILGLIMNLIILKSIQKLDLYFPSYFKAFRYAIWVDFVIAMVSAVFALLIPIIRYLTSVENISNFFQIISIISLIVVVVQLIFKALIFWFMRVNGLPKSNVYLMTLILNVIVLSSFWIIAIFANLRDDIVVIRVVLNVVLSLVGFILLWIIFRDFNRLTETIEAEPEAEDLYPV